MRAGRWLMIGLPVVGAVIGGLVIGDLTTSAIDPYYRQVALRDDDAPILRGYEPTRPAQVSFTPISSVGEWPDAAPPPPEEHAFDEPPTVPTYDYAEPAEPTRFEADPEPVLAMLSEPSAAAIEEHLSPAPTPPATDQPVEIVAPTS